MTLMKGPFSGHNDTYHHTIRMKEQRIVFIDYIRVIGC